MEDILVFSIGALAGLGLCVAINEALIQERRERDYVDIYIIIIRCDVLCKNIYCRGSIISNSIYNIKQNKEKIEAVYYIEETGRKFELSVGKNKNCRE